MSARQILWAWSRTTSHPFDKLVLMAFADRSDKDGWSFMSQPTIAKRAGISQRSVRTSMARLAQDGFILRVERWKKDGSRASDHVKICQDPPAGRAAPPRQDVPTIPSSSYEVGIKKEEWEEGKGLGVGLRLVGGSDL